ncbi:hypothetical protein [Psychrobacillus sp. FSL H8-0510]|uniref:hypothetical protein n=1 Tax=Psychrobacillus sp. FSL H8-0510 TaxID=2921394 RepID=UPI0030FCD09D
MKHSLTYEQLVEKIESTYMDMSSESNYWVNKYNVSILEELLEGSFLKLGQMACFTLKDDVYRVPIELKESSHGMEDLELFELENIYIVEDSFIAEQMEHLKAEIKQLQLLGKYMKSKGEITMENQPAKVIVTIVGGNVQSVIADQEVDVTIVDYDTEGMMEEELLTVYQEDVHPEDAYVYGGITSAEVKPDTVTDILQQIEASKLEEEEEAELEVDLEELERELALRKEPGEELELDKDLETELEV